MDFRMNFNDGVKVRLTGSGEQILRDQHEELNNHILNRGGKGIGPYVSRADPEGWTTFQIWDLMQRLGPHMSIAKPEPFKGEMIFLNGEPIDFPNRTKSDKEFIRAFNESHSKNSP